MYLQQCQHPYVQPHQKFLSPKPRAREKAVYQVHPDTLHLIGKDLIHIVSTVKLKKRPAGINIFHRLPMRVL